MQSADHAMTPITGKQPRIGDYPKDGPDDGPDDGSAGIRVYEDDTLRSIISRALAYMAAGVPVHLRGPAGVGKTTLAHAIASRTGRPLSLLTGDHWMTRADMVGREVGETQRRVRDTYIQRVQRTELSTRVTWRDSVLTEAMEQGHVLLYDEFTRASAAANNTLLSALEERVLVISDPARENRVVRAHPDFAVIVTSNPEDYVGINLAPDALLDRMVTFDMGAVTAATEIGIVAHRSGLSRQDAARIVELVRRLRQRPGSAYPPSMRTAILIARLLVAQGLSVSATDGHFVQICLDVLGARTKPGATLEDREAHIAALKAEIAVMAAVQHCASTEGQ